MFLRTNYKLFIGMLEELLLVKDELLKEKAVLAYNMLIFKAANPEILIDSLPPLLNKFHTLDVTHEDYQNYLKMFCLLIHPESSPSSSGSSWHHPVCTRQTGDNHVSPRGKTTTSHRMLRIPQENAVLFIPRGSRESLRKIEK